MTTTTLVDGTLCPRPRPSSLQPCNMEECGEWVAGAWGKCSAQCGTGRGFAPCTALKIISAPPPKNLTSWSLVTRTLACSGWWGPGASVPGGWTMRGGWAMGGGWAIGRWVGHEGGWAMGGGWTIGRW
ncbi:hypothetical protein GWK47_039246 [Chionoecetes opilio]|uniref:Uncharacterized protein n=1 Tax=Chionoecetes opilio TaxID=41210 RepID=A0A8J4YKA7_CHIOP|nr:hypothetical protein GWK47_039246 [Chionoecetes opilio]